jgi:AmmeMemoRadiSam system protein A
LESINVLSPDDRRTLLRLARDTMAAKLLGKRPQAPDISSEALTRPCGCFVSLHYGDDLRGCIGTFSARSPLYQTVIQMAGAALGDPRFTDHPVTSDELPDMQIEISVLAPMEKCADPMKDVELGHHGICIEGPYGSGCFLPQVATETGWTKEQFFSHCCGHKAGMAPDAWQDPDVTVYRFEAEVFGEEKA